jgi:hypothetical protein
MANFFRKSSSARQSDLPRAQTADSSSTNAVNFSSARTTKRFPSPRCSIKCRFPTAASVVSDEILWSSDCAGLNGAERWPHLVAVLIHNTGWVSPRLIPGSQQSLSHFFQICSIIAYAIRPAFFRGGALEVQDQDRACASNS